MKRCNVIMVFSPEGDRLLFCKRTKEPFRGKYNMVGGHIEPWESDEDAAYRELEEESGIGRSDIRLKHAMDILYHTSGLELQIWAGRLLRDAALREEENPLCWLSVEEDYFDYTRFAGNGNIGHILREVMNVGIADGPKPD